MAERRDGSNSEEIRRERDLYLRLLELGSQRELEPFLKEALALIVEVSGARQGYLELGDPTSDTEDPGWYIARGLSDEEVEGVRSHVSRGIIAETLSSGRIVDTPSAMSDPRFLSRESVRTGQIEAVLCVPVGADPPRGVLYLQGRDHGGPFTEQDRTRARLFAHHLAPLADHLILRRRTERTEDPTQPFREKLRMDGVIGQSPALAALLKEVSLLAPLEVNVLLTGESGTGKSRIARVIHDNSPRAQGPFVELNCAAIPDPLVESELFGAVSGGHSTATQEVPGKVSAAEGGTLLLDEVGELTAPAQAKLLQLLQSREYYRLGASQPSRADIRVIAATNSDLEGAVREGRFREDLFYRLHVLPVRVPSLAERRGDVAALARFFATRAGKRHRLAQTELSTGALHTIEAAEWPGNVRQLEHAIEAAAIRAAGGGEARIESRHVFPDRTHADAEEEARGRTFQEATREFQRELLARTLDETGWNVAATARQLDLARSHVYTLIGGFDLKREP